MHTHTTYLPLTCNLQAQKDYIQLNSILWKATQAQAQALWEKGQFQNEMSSWMIVSLILPVCSLSFELHDLFCLSADKQRESPKSAQLNRADEENQRFSEIK